MQIDRDCLSGCLERIQSNQFLHTGKLFLGLRIRRPLRNTLQRIWPARGGQSRRKINGGLQATLQANPERAKPDEGVAQTEIASRSDWPTSRWQTEARIAEE